MALKLTTLAAKTVAAAGTAEAITATSIITPSVTIQAKAGNTNNIYVGDSTVDSTNGLILTPGDVFTLEGEDRGGKGRDEFMLTDIFIDADTNGEGVDIAYIARRSGTIV